MRLRNEMPTGGAGRAAALAGAGAACRVRGAAGLRSTPVAMQPSTAWEGMRAAGGKRGAAASTAGCPDNGTGACLPSRIEAAGKKSERIVMPHPTQKLNEHALQSNPAKACRSLDVCGKREGSKSSHTHVCKRQPDIELASYRTADVAVFRQVDDVASKPTDSA